MKKKKLGFSKIAGLLAAVMVVSSCTMTVQAGTMPYDTYSYDWWAEDVLQPHAYLYSESFTTQEVKLKNPQDLFVKGDLLYIADTDNSRIVVMNNSGEMLQEIASFRSENGQECLYLPQGVFVTEENHVYVADSGNGRVVEFAEDGSYIRQIGRPETDLIAENQNYVPTKVVVDGAERIYVIAYGINMGLVEFNKNGEFQGFMGATQVSVSAFEYIWKNYFSTDAQKERMETIIPTEYSNIFVDEKDFVYATISNLSDEDLMNGADAVRRLNPTGTDVLRRLGNNDIIGDLYIVSEDDDWSMFTDIAATDYGTYFILDNAGGKVFCYDYDGNSLFIFGGKGGKAGMCKNPTAIGLTDDQSQLYILDAQLGCVLVYDITQYGKCLLGALEAHHNGESEKAYELWQEVIRMNANSEVAYIGIGKTYLKEGRYKEAMEYFELGNSRKYYTKAFQFYRKELMQDNFGKYMGLIGAAVILIFVIKWIKKIIRWVGEVKCSISNP